MYINRQVKRKAVRWQLSSVQSLWHGDSIYATRHDWRVLVANRSPSETDTQHLEKTSMTAWQGGHSGVKKTLEKVWELLYWISCCTAVEDLSALQYLCSKASTKEASCGEMHILNTGVSFERMRLLDPTTRTGNWYILGIMGYFLKWTEALTIADQEITMLADALISNWIGRYVGKSVSWWGWGQLLYPYSDGMVERFIQWHTTWQCL